MLQVKKHTQNIFVKIRRLPAHLQKYLRLVNHVNDCCIPNASEHYLIEHTKVCIQCTCHDDDDVMPPGIKNKLEIRLWLEERKINELL